MINCEQCTQKKQPCRNTNNAETAMQKHKQCRKQLCRNTNSAENNNHAETQRRNTNSAENNYAETQTVQKTTIMQKHKR